MSNFKKAREAKGLSQKEIAITLNVSQPTVSDWEGNKKTPAGKNLKRLTEMLDCSSDYLLGVTDDPSPPGAKKEASASKTPSEAAIEYFVSENGREPTLDELKSFLAVAKGLFSTLPDKAD